MQEETKEENELVPTPLVFEGTSPSNNGTAPGSSQRHKVKIIPRSASKNVGRIDTVQQLTLPGDSTVVAAAPSSAANSGIPAMPQFTSFKFESPPVSNTKYVPKAASVPQAQKKAPTSGKVKAKRTRIATSCTVTPEELLAKQLRRDERLAKKLQAREEQIARGEVTVGAPEVSDEEASADEDELEERVAEIIYCDPVPVDPHVPMRNDWAVQRKMTSSSDPSPMAYDAKMTWTGATGVKQFCILQLLHLRMPSSTSWAVWVRTTDDGGYKPGAMVIQNTFEEAVEVYEKELAKVRELSSGTCVETNTARVTQPMPLDPCPPILSAVGATLVENFEVSSMGMAQRARATNYAYTHVVTLLGGSLAAPEESCFASCELRKKFKHANDTMAGMVAVSIQIIESIAVPKEYRVLELKVAAEKSFDVAAEKTFSDVLCSSLQGAFQRFDAQFTRLTGRPFADRWDVEPDSDASYFYKFFTTDDKGALVAPAAGHPLVSIKIAENSKSKWWREREQEEKVRKEAEEAAKKVEQERQPKKRVRKFESRFPSSTTVLAPSSPLAGLMQTLVSHVLSFFTRRQWSAAVRVCKKWCSAGRLPSAACWTPVREWKDADQWDQQRTNQVLHLRNIVPPLGQLSAPPPVLFSRLRKLTLRWSSVLASNLSNSSTMQAWLVWLNQVAEAGRLEEVELDERMFQPLPVTPAVVATNQGEEKKGDTSTPLSPSICAASMYFLTLLPHLRVLHFSAGICVWTTFLDVLPQLHALQSLSIPDVLTNPNNPTRFKSTDGENDSPDVTADDVRALLISIAGLSNLRSLYIRVTDDEAAPGRITGEALMGDGAPVFSEITSFYYEHIGTATKDLKAYQSLGVSFPKLTCLEILQQTRWGDEEDDDVALASLLVWRKELMTALISGLKAIGHCLMRLTVREAPMTDEALDLMSSQPNLLYFEHPRDPDQLQQLFEACPNLTECNLGCQETAETCDPTWCRYDNASLEQMRGNALTSLRLHEPSDSQVHLALSFPNLKELRIVANETMFPDTREDLGGINLPACGRLRYVFLSHITMTRINFDLLQILPQVDVLEVSDSSMTLPMLVALAQFVPVAFQTSRNPPRQDKFTSDERGADEQHLEMIRTGKKLSELTDILPVPSDYFEGLEEILGTEASSIISRTPITEKHAAAWSAACHTRTTSAASRRCLSQLNFFRFRRITIQDVPGTKKSMRLEDCLGMDENTRYGVTEGHCRFEIARKLALRVEEFECRRASVSNIHA